MPQVLVRDIELAVYEKLKARAARNARSLEAEVRVLLRAAAEDPIAEMQVEVKKVRALFAGRQFSDSVGLLREDRNR